MISEQKRLFLTGAGLVLLFLVSFYCSYQYFKPFEKIKIHDRQIQLNPSAAIDPNKEYFLRLWDYDLPLQKCNYREYLERAIAGFRKLHPKIKVELRLLDLTNGPAELETALEQNDPPDVYGSIFNLPQFDYRYQVPVGPYLDKRKLPALYLPQVLRLASIDNVLCSFPRVVRFNIWLGNPGLLKTAGLSVAEIQRKGWTWAQLFAAKDRYPTGVYTLAGHVIPFEVLRQILPHGCFIEGKGGGTAWDWLKTLKDTQRLPEDFNSNMLGRFLSGKVMVLAGAKPLLLRALRARLARDKAGWEPVALPPPNLNAAQPVCPVEIGGISIYRNPKRNHGSDHVAAAVALGKYLSQYPDARPWEEMQLIPAGARVMERWCKSGSAGDVAVLEALVAQGGFTDWKTPPVYPEHISRALLEYLTGVIPREKVIERFKTEMACD